MRQGTYLSEAAQEASLRQPNVWGKVAGNTLLSLLVALFAAFLALPLIALLLRVPLSDLGAYLNRPLVQDSLRLSILTTGLSLALMLLFGTPVAYVLGRYRFPGKRLFETLIEVPLVLPPAVAGVALLLAFGRRGMFGPALETAGLEIAFSTAAVVLAQTFVASPFYVRAARIGFSSVSRELEDAAATEGAGRWARFQHVIFPLALPGIVGGAVLAWARALGEFGATILFAGNFAGRTQTMPLAIYSALETDLDAAILLSSILIVFSFTLLVVFKLVSGQWIEAVGMD